MSKLKKISLPVQIFIAMILGGIVGLVVGEKCSEIGFIGTVWLNMIKMVMVPVVLTLVVKGIASVDDPKTLGLVGGKIMTIYVLTTILAGVLGVVTTEIFKPGVGFTMTMDVSQVKVADFPGISDFVLYLFSSNMFASFTNANMMQVLIISIIFGLALVKMNNENSRRITGWVTTLSEFFMKIIGMVMTVAPIGVFCLMASTMGKYGVESLSNIAKLLGTFYFTCLLHILVVYGLLLLIGAKMNPIKFLKDTSESWLTAMSTCSSAATVPVSLKLMKEKLHVNESISNFSIPLGATVNQDGGAILSGVVVLFCAQAVGIHFGIGQILNCIVLTTLVCTGSTGLPGGGIMRLLVVAAAMNLPLEVVAVVSAFYRLFDMGTTSLSVMGDMAVTTVVDRWEKKRLEKQKQNV